MNHFHFQRTMQRCHQIIVVIKIQKNLLKMTGTERIKNMNNKIKKKKAQIDLVRRAAKIWELPS